MQDSGEKAIADQIAYYRARAPEYDEEFQGAHDPALVAALAAARPSGTVLELACGSGAWTESLVTHPVESILAVDAAPEMLALHAGRIRDARVERVVADLFRWTPPRRFDFVTFAFWISHVPPARLAAFWQMVGDAIRPGGRAFFVDQDERGLAYEQPSDDRDYPTVARELRDGRQMTAIKVYHRPADLERALRDLGWEATIQPVPGGLFWAEARPASG
jgi:demethylmenaquinone methyltransferase/2-methoxy-6-polyprenyl-1,4-benzoquinol methylase